MRLNQSISALVAGTTTVMALVAQPAQAAQTEVTNIQLRSGANGLELVLNTQGNNRPPIFTVSQGNSTIADINDTQLRLTGGKTFKQANPAPGITAIAVSQLDPDTVRVTVQGTNQAPAAQVIRQDQGETLVLSYKLVASLSESTPSAPTPLPPATGQPPNAVPPFRPRAIAPPVGDIAVAPIDVSPETIDLGTEERISRLLLREAPVREVLTLLGRAAGVNIAFAEGAGSSGATQEGETTGTTTSGGPTISLDIENESVQEVFNYVLRVSGLQASKVGNTIFVGQSLPSIAQNRVVRTLRLNQIKATSTSTTTDTLTSKAETGGNVSAGGTLNTSTTAQTAINRTTETNQTITGRGAKEILESYGANGGGTSNSEEAGSSSEGKSSELLKGLQVVADARLNTVTLLGTPRTVEIATSIIKQLDLRRRQVAVNVKFVDVNLLKGKNANADLQYRVNNTLGFGFTPDPNNPQNSGFRGLIGNIGTNAVLGTTFGITPLARNFLLNIFASIQNQDAKILTNPTLLIQEGSSAQVNLTEQIFTGFEQVTQEIPNPGGGTTTATSLKPIIQNAGVILNVTVENIDDNGFITLKISPEVSALSGRQFTDQFGNAASLLQQRRLETGQLRLRDGQTLVLTGIIQDSDRVNVSKVPILGDIPLLGRLFRRETKSRSRNELVVIVTPKILSDSDQSNFGYEYTPSPETQKLLDR